MNLQEFWFLDVVVELRLSVATLASPHLELSLNRKSHGLAREELVSMLLRLRREGLIEFEREGTFPDPTPELLLGEFEHQAQAKPHSRLYFGLSSKGGGVWERLTRPDWSRFIDGPSESPDDGAVEAAAMDRERLEHELLVSRKPLETEEMTYVDLIWSREEPWRATYWKVLPFGIRVRARYQTRSTGDFPTCSMGSVLRKSWRRRAAEHTEFRRWYHSPFGG